MMSRNRILMLVGIAVFSGVPSPLLASSVGVASAVNTSAVGTAPTGGVRTLTLGDNIIFNEKIRTDADGLLQILLADGTSFTVGPNSDLTIDKFVYDPDTGNAEVAATMTKGVFRFIGAKTSKFAGGVKLNTPVGTIGIRGAVTDITLPGDGGGRFDMIFGDEMTLTGTNGQTHRVYEPGYSIVASGQGSRSANVTKTPQGASTAIQAAFTGKIGTSGGSPNKPDDEDAQSMTASNSGFTPDVANPPIPTSRPAGDADETVTQEANRDVVTKVVNDEIENGGGEPELPEEISVRILTADVVYQTDGEPVSDPGSKGLIGGSETADQNATLDVSRDGTGTGSVSQGNVVLPVYVQSNFSKHTISASDGFTFNGAPLSGTVYAGADGFATYLMAIDGDRTAPLVAITGTPTKDMSIFQDGDVRTYSFTPDMLQNIVIPFALAGSIPGSESSASVSDFLVIEPEGEGPIKFLQTSLLIKGQGAEQVSEIGVNVGEIFDDNGIFKMDFGRRGGVRGSSAEIARTFRGGITTQAGATEGNEIFGKNGQNFVLGTASEINDYYNNSPGDFSGSQRFGTLHVFNLEEEQTLSNYLGETAATRLLVGQPALRGFAAGLEQGVRAADGSQYSFNSISRSADDLYIAFDGEGNSLGGELTVGTSGTTLSVAFGDGVKGNTERGASAYIDDDTFAAINNRSRTRTNLRDIDGNGNIVTEFLPIQGLNNTTYLVSGDATFQEDALPGGKLCDCEFLEWGWWGTQISASSDQDSENPEVRSTVHLGTWVAGDITSNVELGTLAGTTGRFEGKAIGTVLATADTASASYIASGDVNMNFDFGARNGSFRLSNFDGRNFTSNVSSDTGKDAAFSGSLLPDGNDAFGSVKGAFVNDGNTIAKGIAGNFSLGSGSDWSAVGIFGGARD